MRVWSVVSQKGGVGKTTLVLHLSIAAMMAGRAVSVIDLDPQRSAEQWSEHREARVRADEPIIVHGTPTSLDGMLAAARETSTDLVIIDTPPTVDKSLIYAAAAGHLVIVPTRSSVLDQFALKETLEYLKRIGALAKTIVVLNAPSSDKKGIEEIAKVARDGFRVALVETTLEDQVDLAKSLREGKGITEGGRKSKAAKAAARAIEAIYGELRDLDAAIEKRRSRGAA